jgi:hypothetical protein
MTININQTGFRDRREWLATHLRNTDQKAVQLKTIIDKLKKDFSSVWSRIQDHNYEFIGVLIGAASGGLEIPLIQEFITARGNKKNFGFFAEDISPVMKEEFCSLASCLNLKDTIKSYDLSPFENPKYSPPLADFILASHSWYYISSWREEPRQTNALVNLLSY